MSLGVAADRDRVILFPGWIRLGSRNAAGPLAQRVLAATTRIYAPRWQLVLSMLRQWLFAGERIAP